MKLTLSVLENHSRDEDKHWPNYIFGGRVRTSTLVLIIVFFATWWTYNTYKPQPTPPPVAPQVVPPGYVPDPNYTWVPRTRLQQPTYDTPTTAVPTTTPPTTPPTTTTPPPLIPTFVLPPPFGPGTTPPDPSTPTPPPGPVPAPAPAPGLPGLPGLPR
jgi:hypothetical protein